MPGRLIMDQQGGNAPQAHDFALKHKTLKSQSHPAMNGHKEEVPPSDSPPALDQSWRDSHANKSMGVLIERLTQKCYTDLNEVITKMAELPTPSSAQPNGISLSTTDTSPESVARKRLWMEFAQNQRDRFIKTLVLADWSRNEQDMAKLIDLRVWQDKQRNSQSGAISFIGAIKHNLMTAKMPNPNIEGALELLSTGRASHIPDLGYLPPKRLSAKQLLRTLQDMNVTLTTRLNLHEDLPAHFNDYTIADGRATFRVAQEFEVDLSVADEDPASPFYFIDLRFSFSPASMVMNEQLRAALEGRCNAAMASKGLQGCYDFLHNFVLTHKLNVIRSQAGELLRGKWFDCLRLNTPRRVLTVQYWSSRPGPKSWLEFGIATGKRKGVQSRKPPTPCLVVRWFREAEEVKDDPVQVNWQNIDLEKILEVVTAKHTSWSLRRLGDNLNTLAGSRSKLKANLTTSTEIPEECALALSLPAMPVPLTVRHEPLTGYISLSPPTPLTTRIESRLNRDPRLDRTGVIATLLCSIVHERVARMADLLGWMTAAPLARHHNLAELFGKDALIRSMYTCNERWGVDWTLVATFSLSGEKWWVVRLETRAGNQGASGGLFISATREIPLEDTEPPDFSISQQYLLDIERLAETEVSFAALSKELTGLDIPHYSRKLSPSDPESPRAMYVPLSALLGYASGRGKAVWATGHVLVTHEAVETDSSAADGSPDSRHDIHMAVKTAQFQQLQDYLTRGRRSDITLSTSGDLGLRIRVPFGQPFVRQLRTHLRNVKRLNHCLGVLKSYNLECIGMNSSRLAFCYSKTPALSAQVLFSRDESLPVRLKFEPRGNNPHQRIRAVLEKHINLGNKDFFGSLTQILSTTLPLLQSLEQIESKDGGRSSVFVHIRQATWINLTYKAPLPPCAWEVRCRSQTFNRKTHFTWQIRRSERTDLPTLPDSIKDALKEMYERKGTDWWGNGSAIVAHPSAIGMALEQLDRTMRRFEGIEIKPEPDELDSKPLIQQTSVKPAPAPLPPRTQQPQAQSQAQPPPMQRQPSQQRPPQQTQRPLPQQNAPQMQRQPSQQAAQQMQRQSSLQATAPMQRQPSQQRAQQMQRQMSQQQMHLQQVQQVQQTQQVHQMQQMQQMQRQMSQQQQQQQQPQAVTPQQRALLQHQQHLKLQQLQQQQQQGQMSRQIPPNAAYLQQNRPPNGGPTPNTRSDPIEID